MRVVVALGLVVVALGLGLLLEGRRLARDRQDPWVVARPWCEVPADGATRRHSRARRVSSGRTPLATRTWTIHAVKTDGVPLPGLHLKAPVLGKCGRTDKQGMLRLEAPEHLEWISVETEDLEPRHFHLTKTRTVLRFPRALPMDLVFLDAKSGKPVSGGAVWLQNWIEFRGRTGTLHLDAVPAEPGGWFNSDLSIDPPPCYAVAEFLRHVQVRVPHATRKLRLVVPLYPECRLRLRVADSAGRPSSNPPPHSVWFGDQRLRTKCDTGAASNEYLLRGIPYLPGHRMSVAGQTFVWPRRRETARTVIAPWKDLFHDPVQGDWWPTPWPKDTKLEIRVLDHTGAPLAGTRVTALEQAGSAATWLRSGPDGWIRTEAPVGGIDLILDGRDGTYTNMRIETERGKTTRVELRESGTRTLQVKAVGPDESPAPFVRIACLLGEGTPFEKDYVRGADGVQDLRIYTDIAGEIDLPGFPDSKEHLTARLGGWSGEAWVPQGEHEVVIHLKPGR